MARAPLETDPQDVELAADGDIRLDEHGLHFVSGLQAIEQAIRFRVLMFFGEWFLNKSIGVPWFEELIGDASKRPGVENRARAALAAAILDVPGVVAILQLNVGVDRSTRKLTATCQVRAAYGDTGIVKIVEP